MTVDLWVTAAMLSHVHTSSVTQCSSIDPFPKWRPKFKIFIRKSNPHRKRLVQVASTETFKSIQLKLSDNTAKHWTPEGKRRRVCPKMWQCSVEKEMQQTGKTWSSRQGMSESELFYDNFSCIDLKNVHIYRCLYDRGYSIYPQPYQCL